MSINAAPWMNALEGQLNALWLVNQFLTNAPVQIRDLKSWNVDKRMLQMAAPYAWSTESIAAVLKASKSIPLDTSLNQFNLGTETAWWWFETPLPFQSMNDPGRGVQAMNFGWVPTAMRDFGLPVCLWIEELLDDDVTKVGSKRPPWAKMTPSQTFEWEQNVTLGEMLIRTRQYHQARYAGHKADGLLDVEVFMATTESIARFMLAGLAWLKQSVLVTTDGAIERHRRKEFIKLTTRPINTVRIVHLRRMEYTRHEPIEHKTVDWSCRWVVEGFWRNQPHGPNHSERRLTYVMPFMKGPADKPLRISAKKVFQVDR